jgi:hypothetical protein
MWFLMRRGLGRWRDRAIREYSVHLFPLLLMTWVVFILCRLTGIAKKPGRAGKAMIVAAAALFSFVPFSGLSFADYLLSLSPSYSIGSMIFLAVVLSNNLLGRPLLRSKDFLLFSLWNVVLSVCLFASVLGFVGPDLYALGYGFSFLFICMALLTIVLVILRHRLGLIFIAYIAAFDLRLLPSSNFFDYMTDGLLFILSSGVVVYYLSRIILKAPARQQSFRGSTVGRE